MNRLPTTGQVAQQRHRGLVLGFGQLEDTADHHRAAVLHQHLRLDVLGVDRDAGGRGLAAAVLVDVQVEDDVALGRDLRRDFQLERGLAERHRGGAAGGGLLVREFRALLDQRLGLVGRHDARAGHQLALAVGFQRGEFQVQEAVGAALNSEMAKVAGAEAALADGRQVDEGGVGRVSVAASPWCRRPRRRCRRKATRLLPTIG